MELRLRLFEFVGRWWLLETSDEEAPLVTDVPPGSTVSKTDVGLISAMDVLLCGDRFAEFVELRGLRQLDMVVSHAPLDEAWLVNYARGDVVLVWREGVWEEIPLTYTAKVLLCRNGFRESRFYVAFEEVDAEDTRWDLGGYSGR